MNKQAWIQCALEKGMDSLEIYQSLSSRRSMTWYEGKLDTLTNSRVMGTSIRGVYQDKMANMAFEKIADEDKEKVIDQLIEQAKLLSTKEPDQIRAPESFEIVKKETKWVSPSNELVQQTLQALEQKLKAYDPRILQVNELGYEEAFGSRCITNSLGLDVQDEDQMQILMAYVVAGQGEDVQVNYEVEIVEDLARFDLDAFVKKVCDKALEKLQASSIPSQSMPVIFESEAMTSLFESFVGLFNGELLYKGISCLKDKMNEKIFSDKITIVDDPRNTDALSIANFDDEGCPTYRKTLVDQGVFVQALHSTKTANCMHTQSTGNGFKSGYASTVGVSPMNCQIIPGNHSLEELCQIMNDGLVITDLQGLHAGIDFVSTNFSLQASGYLVKEGKRSQSVTLITVAANFMELMRSVMEVGNDLDWSYHTIKSPSIYFEKCAISGE